MDDERHPPPTKNRQFDTYFTCPATGTSALLHGIPSAGQLGDEKDPCIIYIRPKKISRQGLLRATPCLEFENETMFPVRARLRMVGGEDLDVMVFPGRPLCLYVDPLLVESITYYQGARLAVEEFSPEERDCLRSGTHASIHACGEANSEFAVVRENGNEVFRRTCSRARLS